MVRYFSTMKFLIQSPTDVQCRDYHNVDYNSTWICNFMKNTSDCQMDDGFINYLTLTYCSFSLDNTWIPICLMAFWLFVLFVGLGVTADAFFCPSLRVIADTMRLSQNIAGVTFLAFGNGAPDVFSAIAAVGNSKGDDVGLAFGALFGAGVFVSTVVVGIICFICPFTSVQRPLLRDLIFFMLSGFWAFLVVWDGVIYLWETLGFLILYVVYIVVVVLGRYVNQKIKIKRGGPILKNDFSCASVNHNPNAARTSKAEYEVVTNGDEESEADENYEREILTRPLLDKIANEEREILNFEFSNSIAVRNTFIPLDLDEWKESNWFFKMMIVVKAPVIFLLKITVPLVDYDVRNHNWNKMTIIANCLLAPLFIIFAIKCAFIEVFKVVPLWSIALFVGCLAALFIALKTSLNERPRFHWIFAYLGFVVSTIWIYTIANEIVNLLTAFGVILNLSNTILGLTFLAWGNSLSDLVADVFSAKNGFPNMGISACFGGPLFNILLGVGIPFTYKSFKQGTIQIKQSFLQDILALFLGISLCSTLIFIPLNKFKFTRGYGIYLIAVYVVFLTICILIESNVIKY